MGAPVPPAYEQRMPLMNRERSALTTPGAFNLFGSPAQSQRDCWTPVSPGERLGYCVSAVRQLSCPMQAHDIPTETELRSYNITPTLRNILHTGTLKGGTYSKQTLDATPPA